MTEDDDKPTAGNRRAPSRNRRKTGQQSAFEVVADKSFKFVLNGVGRKLNPEEALQQKIFQQGLNGSVRAVREIYKWIERREAVLAPPPGRFPTIKIECDKPEGVNEALLILGLATAAPEHRQSNGQAGLLLATDVVTNALARKKVSRGPKEMEEIRSQTIDPDQIADDEDWAYERR